MAQSYSVQAVLSAVDNGFTSTFNTATNTAMSMGEKVSSSLKTIGNVTSIVGAATTAMGVAGLKSFGQFQQSLNTAAVVAGGTSKDIQGLSDVANKMGADLPISAQQAAEAMTEMARNGASVGQIKEQFPAIAQAATAAGADLTATAGVVQQAMNIWGNSLKSPQQAAEILVQTANMSNASIEDMQQAMATFSGTAKLAGMNMQDSTEAIGLLTNKGFSAAQASQDLNNAVLQMIAPSQKAKSTMNELGISFTDAQGKMKSFPQILQDLNKSMDGLTDSEKTKKLKAMFGTSGMAAIAPLMDAMKNHTNDSTKSWDAWANAVDKAAGTGKASEKSLKDQANEMQKNIGAKIEQVGGNWEALRNTSLASHNAVSGAMLDLINKTLSWANASHSGFAKFIQGAIGLAPVLGPVVTVTGQFLAHAERIGRVAVAAGRGIWNLVARFTPLPKITPKASAGMDRTGRSAKKAGKSAGESASNFLKIGTAILEIGVGVGVAVASFALLTIAVTKLAKQSQGLQTFLAVSAGIVVMALALGVVGKMIGSLGASAAIGFAGMALLIGSFTLLTLAVKSFASTGTQGVIALTALTVAIAAITVVIGLFAPVLQASALGLVAFGASVVMLGVGIAIASASIALLVFSFTGLVNAITALASQGPIAIGVLIALGLAVVAMSASLAIFGPLLTVSAIGLLAFGAAVLMAGIGIGIATAGIAMLVNAIASLISTNTAVGQIIMDVWNGIKSIISGTVNFLKPIVSAGFNFIKGIVSGAMNGMRGVISTVWNGIKSLFSGGVNFIKSVVHVDLSGQGRAIMNSFFDGLKSVWNSIKSFISGIAGWIESHKGPISYDRKLLIPAGRAIMQGLNNGLVNEFTNVQSNVSSMAERIANAATVTVPEVDTNNFSRSLTALNSQMDNSGISVNGRLSATNTFNANSRSFEDQVTTLIAQAVNKLDNVDQHPEITFDTASKLNRKFNEWNVAKWQSAKG